MGGVLAYIMLIMGIDVQLRCSTNRVPGTVFKASELAVKNLPCLRRSRRFSDEMRQVRMTAIVRRVSLPGIAPAFPKC
jgi:hypothetical protein